MANVEASVCLNLVRTVNPKTGGLQWTCAPQNGLCNQTSGDVINCNLHPDNNRHLNNPRGKTIVNL
jgi:hypothetical protein